MPTSAPAHIPIQAPDALKSHSRHIAGYVYFTFICYVSIGLPLAVLPPFVHLRMGYSAVLAGLAISIQYIATLASRPWAGRISDHMGAKVSVLWGMACCTASGALLVGAAVLSDVHWLSFTVLIASRLVLGVGEAPTFPANAKAVGYWFPKAERTFGTAIFDSAAKFGAALGAPLLGLVLEHFGWRWCFAASGIISVVFFAMFALYYKNPSEDAKLTIAEREFIARGGAQPEDKVRAAQGAPLGYL